MVVEIVFISSSFLTRFYKGVSITRCLLSLWREAKWRRRRHRRAGHSRLKLFLMQATCRRATPPLKVARQVHVTKRTTTTQKGAADGTQRNDEKGGKQIRELRRLFAGKILGALPCVQDAPGLWIFPARMYIEHGPDASDTVSYTHLTLPTNREV